MVGFLPTPYPNECLYSIICRYYSRCGDAGYETVSKLLFGNVQNLTASVYLPARIENVDNWTSPPSGITRRNISEKHTLYPYWTITYTPDFRAETERVIDGGIPVAEFDRIGALKSRRSWSRCLKYCPQCAAEDIVEYGETYWRRQHQLSEMLYCVKHNARLIDSEVSVKRAATGLYPASSEASLTYHNTDNLAPYKDKFLKIGQECEWLTQYGLEVDWSANGYDKYWKLLRDKGLASFQGRCDYLALDTTFNDYWGKDFIDVLLRETADTRFKGWTYQIDKNKMLAYKPLYHILLMCFLAGSVADFVESNPADTPYGHPPFVCENPICPHYHVDGAEMVAMRYYGNGVTAGFECSHCGMRYRHNKAKHSRELRVIANYGHLWDSELRRCCADPKITNEQTANILKCSMSVLMLQKKKRGLLESALYDTEIGPEKYYKDRVSELCEEYDEVTIALLQEKVPGAYSYLGDHHKDWLRSRIVFENERKHRREREEELLDKVREVALKFTTEGYPNRQVTYGYVAGLAGTTRDELRCRRTPNSALRALLDNTIESRSDWIRRRDGDIYNEKNDK